MSRLMPRPPRHSIDGWCIERIDLMVLPAPCGYIESSAPHWIWRAVPDDPLVRIPPPFSTTAEATREDVILAFVKSLWPCYPEIRRAVPARYLEGLARDVGRRTEMIAAAARPGETVDLVREAWAVKMKREHAQSLAVASRYAEAAE